jgi:hypothetical protein
MRKTMLLLAFIGLAGLLRGTDQTVNLSGTWVLNVQESDPRARQGYLSSPLVIVQTEDELQLHITNNGKRTYESFRLDGKNSVTQMPNGAEVTIKVKLKRDAIEVTNENKYPGGEAKITRKYSLSKDGKTLNMSTAGMKLVYRKAEAAFEAASQPKSQSPPTKVLKPESYAAAALEAVRSRRPDERTRIEVVGAPVLKPAGSRLPAIAPDAIVRVNLCSGEIVSEQAMVFFFEGRPPMPQFSPPKDNPFPKATMNRNELEEISGELESFFADAVDVGRGAERFYRYLPDDIRSLLKHPDRKFRLYMPPGAVDPSWREKLAEEAAARGATPTPLEGVDGWREKLSDDELRRFVALTLETLIQQSLLEVIGHSKEARDQAARQRPQTLVSNPREAIKLAEEIVSQNRRLLKAVDILNPEHLKPTSGYMELLIGKGFVVKEVSQPNPCPCFHLSPEDAALYVSSFGAPFGGPSLHFSRMSGKLRIVCVALP